MELTPPACTVSFRLYLADEPIDDILPRVDEVFGLLTDLEQMYQLYVLHLSFGNLLLFWI